MLDGVFDDDQLAALRADVERVFEECPPDQRGDNYSPDHWAPFRYEMLNRSAAVQQAIGHPSILGAIEPLLGEDCHVIANTAWWQKPGENDHLGRFWHIDSGPHVPRDADIPWDPRIPYPVFAIAAHLFLQDCPIESGPTGVIPGSHTSGQSPPFNRLNDDALEWNGPGREADSGQGRRRRPLCLGRLAPPPPAGTGRSGSDVRPVPLRTARHRAAVATHK